MGQGSLFRLRVYHHSPLQHTCRMTMKARRVPSTENDVGSVTKGQGISDLILWCTPQAHWPEELLDFDYTQPMTGPNGSLIWNGLRVRIGMNLGETSRQFVHGRVDYMGPSVNLAARVEAKAAGGQIVCTSAVIRCIQRSVVRLLLTALPPRSH